MSPPRPSPSFTLVRSAGGTPPRNAQATTWMITSHLRRGRARPACLAHARDLGQVNHLEHDRANREIEHAHGAEAALARDASRPSLGERGASRIHEQHAVLQDRALAVRAREGDDVDRTAELLAHDRAHVEPLECRQAPGWRGDLRTRLLLEV